MAAIASTRATKNVERTLQQVDEDAYFAAPTDDEIDDSSRRVANFIYSAALSPHQSAGLLANDAGV
jgi:hypothetical protein